MAVVNIKTVVPEGAAAVVMVDITEAEDLFFGEEFQPVRNVFPFNALAEHLINTDDPEEIICELTDIISHEFEDVETNTKEFVAVKDLLQTFYAKLEELCDAAMGDTQHEFDFREAQVRFNTAKVFLS